MIRITLTKILVKEQRSKRTIAEGYIATAKGLKVISHSCRGYWFDSGGHSDEAIVIGDLLFRLRERGIANATNTSPAFMRALMEQAFHIESQGGLVLSSPGAYGVALKRREIVVHVDTTQRKRG